MNLCGNGPQTDLGVLRLLFMSYYPRHWGYFWKGPAGRRERPNSEAVAGISGRGFDRPYWEGTL